MGMFSPHLTPWRNLCSGFSTMGELLRDGLQFLRTISRSRAALSAEILFLRKQLAYYQDHRIRPRRLRDASRLCLLFWSRLFDWPAALVVVKTSTFLRWHSKGFKWYWRWKSRGGRPPLPKEIRQLIARMVRENVTWGEERIADELSLKLGIYVSPRTVRKYWPQQPGMGSGRRRTASQPWKTFVRNHAQGIVACDFLVVVTARFRILFVFVALEIGSRRILHCNVTAHPTAEWTLQQLRDAIPSDHPYQFLIHDRDTIFSSELDAEVKDLLLFHDEEVFSVNLDLGAGVLAEQNAIAFLYRQREQFAFVIGLALADRDDFAFLRFVFSRIGNDDATSSSANFFYSPDQLPHDFTGRGPILINLDQTTSCPTATIAIGVVTTFSSFRSSDLSQSI